MRHTLLTFILIVTCACAAFGAVTQIPKMKTIPYEGWGFQIDVPQMSRRVALKAQGEVELWDMHTYGDFVYFVKVVKVTPETLTSTAIEQDIQADANFAAKRGATKRWEMEGREGELFKGLNYFSKTDEDIPEAAAELLKVLRGRTGCVSAAWAPLKGESGPMLILGVIGPKGRDDEIDNLEKFFVRGMNRIKAGEAAAVTTRPVRPGPTKAPVAPKPATAALPVLKKGDIQITGAIESMTMDKRRLTISAQEIKLPGGEPVKLEPARRKVISLNMAMAGLAVGDRVTVVGRNTGVGKPMTADVVVKAP